MNQSGQGLVGSQPSAVLQLLRERNNGTSERLDGRKLGLIVEGGGMRGVLSAGSLLALDILGYRSCFDAVFAVSAGSVNAAYFLSGQGTTGITVYFDDISSRRFINPLRFWKIADVDYVYDYLVTAVKPLNEEAIRKSPQAFYVTATDVNTGERVLLDAKERSASVSRFLKASSALPVLYNRSVPIDGHRYMDGGASGGLPIDWALRHGCTDLLVLLSRPCSYVVHGPRFLERSLFRMLLGFRYPKMYLAFLQARTSKEANQRLALGKDQVPGVNIATICPDDADEVVGRTTIDRGTLVNGAYLCAAKVFALFGGDLTLLESAFQDFR